MTPAVRDIAVGGLRNPPFWRVFCCPGECNPPHRVQEAATAIEGGGARNRAQTGPPHDPFPHGLRGGFFPSHARRDNPWRVTKSEETALE